MTTSIVSDFQSTVLKIKSRNSLDQVREVSKKEFIGAESFEFGVNIIAQARQYVEEMARVRGRDGDDKLKSIKTCAFWASKKAVWPELAAIALY